MADPDKPVDVRARWQAAVRRCPHCAGTRRVQLERGLVRCPDCHGTGDLFGVLLLDAYRQGRQDTMAAVREVARAREHALRRVQEAEPTASELLRRAGVGDAGSPGVG